MRVLLNSIALEPNRWTKDKIAAHDLEKDLLPRIADAGFTQVEIWQFHLSRKNDAEVKAAREKGGALGLAFPVVGAYPLFHLDGAEGEEARAANEQVLEHAMILGAKWVKFFFGRVKGSEITPEQLERTLTHVTEWIAAGAAKGLSFCAELHGGTLFDPFEAGEKHLSRHPEWNCRICYQPYDMKNTPPNLELICQLGERIVHVHFQGRDADGFCRLADADLDYTKIIPALKEANPDFIPSVEFVRGGFPKEGEAFDFDAALADAAADARFIEEHLKD